MREPVVKCKNCRGEGIKPARRGDDAPHVCGMCAGLGIRAKRPQPGTRRAIARRYGVAR